MHINGCHIVGKLDASGDEGFISIVTRSQTVVTKDAGGKDITTETLVTRGPFKSILAAQLYAHSWNDAANPPEIPAEPVPVITDPEVPPVVVPPVPEQVSTVVHEAS